MSDYPSIRPEDVREGDVVEASYRITVGDGLSPSIVSLIVDRSTIAGEPIAVDLRLVSRPTPPEPALRVGEFVRWASGIESQVQSHDLGFRHHATRIEPPVGWPVGVPQGDGSVHWYASMVEECRYQPLSHHYRYDNYGKTWSDLVAAGGIPALAPAATP